MKKVSLENNLSRRPDCRPTCIGILFVNYVDYQNRFSFVSLKHYLLSNWQYTQFLTDILIPYARSIVDLIRPLLLLNILFQPLISTSLSNFYNHIIILGQPLPCKILNLRPTQFIYLKCLLQLTDTSMLKFIHFAG